MAEHSAIEWTDATWNPTTGCTKVSPACANCYIERTPSFRVRGRKFVNGHIPIEFHPDRLDMPLKRRKPTMYFVNSLSDLFHEDVPDTFIDKVFAVMALARQHTFQILTKRAERARDYLATPDRAGRWNDAADHLNVSEAIRAAIRRRAIVDGDAPTEGTLLYRECDSATDSGTKPLPNVWLGVSVENQRFADERIPLLLQTPAAVRFISAEPLLGPVDLRALPSVSGIGRYLDALSDAGAKCSDVPHKLDLVIVGAESGPRQRPTIPEWVRSLRDQCVSAGVAFFFKQWGGRTAKSGGRILDGRTWDEMPCTSTAATRSATRTVSR